MDCQVARLPHSQIQERSLKVSKMVGATEYHGCFSCFDDGKGDNIL